MRNFSHYSSSKIREKVVQVPGRESYETLLTVLALFLLERL